MGGYGLDSQREIDLEQLYKGVFESIPIGINIFKLEDSSDPGSFRFVPVNAASSSAAGVTLTVWSVKQLERRFLR